MATVTKRQADNTSFAFGQETPATGAPISDRTQLVQRRYVATSFALDEDAEKVASDALRAGYSDVFGELNGLWGSGAIALEVPEGEGLLPIAQGLLGDRNPVSTLQPNKTLLPAGTPLTKHIVAGENLFGQGQKQVLDNMRQYAQAVALEVSTDSATLIDTTVDGTVVLRYDVNGTETDLTTTFTDANKATPQTASLPANAKVVSVRTTGFSAGTFSIAAKIVVVDGHTLTTAAVTVADDLSTHPQAMIVTLAPNSAAALTTATTPGTVTFTYTVTGTSGSQTKVVSFANAVVTDAQTIELPANATITGIAVAGFSAGEMDIDASFEMLDTSFFQNEDDIDVSAVKGQTLNATIAVADDLIAYTRASVLTVSPSEDADLTAAATPATVVINYDANGESKSGTLSFADAVKTTAQTFDLPANSEITSVTTTGWSGGVLDITAPVSAELVYSPDFNRPGRLRVECTTENPDGTIKVKGLRKVGISSKDDFLIMDETLELSATGSATIDVLLDKYFARILNITIADADGEPLADGSVELTAEPGNYETVIKVADQELIEHTIEAEVGGIPRLCRGVQFVGGTISNEGTLSVELDTLCRRVDKHRTVEGGWDEKFISTMETHSDEFPFVSIGFFSGIGGYLEIDGDVVLFDSAPITINSNYDFDTEKAGSIFRPAAERQGRRQVTTSVSAKYQAGSREEDVFVRWDRKFRDNEAVKVRLVQYRWAANGRQKALIWDMPFCEITAPVRVEATSPGSIPITIALKATPDPTTDESAEITLTLINEDMAA